MLQFILDENMTPEIAMQVRAKRAGITIFSVHTWREGLLLGADDEAILRTAATAGLTLVTHDLRSIPSLTTKLTNTGCNHAGVVYACKDPRRHIDFGDTVNEIVRTWDTLRDEDWTNRIVYLQRRK